MLFEKNTITFGTNSRTKNWIEIVFFGMDIDL